MYELKNTVLTFVKSIFNTKNVLKIFKIIKEKEKIKEHKKDRLWRIWERFWNKNKIVIEDNNKKYV